jgi:hypothetical protein
MAKNTLGTYFKKVLVNYLKTGHPLFDNPSNQPLPLGKAGYFPSGNRPLPSGERVISLSRPATSVWEAGHFPSANQPLPSEERFTFV